MKGYLLDTNICVYFLNGKFDLEHKIEEVGIANCFIAAEKARLKTKGRILDDFDLLIGATAVYNSLIMVTKNVSDFDRITGIQIEDWTKS